jgi:PAS domain S-box-containing protein
MTNFTGLLRGVYPRKLKKEEFTEKIGLTAIGVSLIIIALIISLFVLYTKQKRQKELIDNGITLTEVVAGYSAKGLDEIDASNIITTVEKMGKKSGLMYGMIMDVSGRIVAHTDINLVGEMLTDQITARVVSSNNPLKQEYEDPGTSQTVYEFSRPIYTGNKKAGSVRLGFSHAKTPLFSSSDLRALIIIAILFFSVVPIFYYVVRRSLRPLVFLSNELNYLLENNEFRKVEVNSGKGMGKLIDRFNHVITRLKDKYEKLNVSYEDIEVANKVLSYEKERVESIVENINDGIMVTDSVGSIILVNRAMAHMMNISDQDVIGKSVRDCFENKEILSLIERNRFSGSAIAQKNIEITLKQFGGECIVLISYLPLLSPEEAVLGNIIIARDITGEKMNKQKQSDFLAHIAHELRTPLTTIKSYVEMMMDNEVNDQETKIDFYNTINDEVNRLSRLISNLLNISKIEMGSLGINRDFIKSKEFLTDIVTLLKGQALSKEIDFESFLPEKLSPLVAEKDLLRIAILNILGNAIKYTPKGGTVTLRVEETDSEMRLDIIDTGYGISKEELPYVFDKFFRSADEKIKSHTGNGLGLALTKEIIRLHDGTVHAESTIGEGTHFTITLPLEENPRIGSFKGSYSSLAD